MTIVKSVVSFAALAVLASSCSERTLPPRGQLLVFVDTDAPLGNAPGEIANAMDPAPLFDRLRVEVLNPASELACEACRQDFVLTRDILARGASSVGIVVPAARSDLRLRARLFRSIRQLRDEPAPQGTIDALFALPAIGVEGVVDVTAFLPLESVGRPADFEAPPPLVTSGKNIRATLHDGIQPQSCATEPTTTEVCVPGGAYWMSSVESSTGLLLQEQPERVVILSSFLVDRAEVTVAEMRASGLASATDPVVSTGAPGSCTFTAQAGTNEDLPVSCVSWALADRFCKARGAELPTEAQFEFLMSGRRSQRYVWGSDVPSCTDLVYLRSVPTSSSYIRGVTDVCAGLGVGPARAGSAARDTLRLPGGDVVDLAGNLSEWTRDSWQLLDGSCWGTGLFVDPFCQAPASVKEGHVRRGTAWSAIEVGARATSRLQAIPFPQVTEQAEVTGFRCVRPNPQ